MSAATQDQPTPTGEGPEVWTDLIGTLQAQLPALRILDSEAARIAELLLLDFRERDRTGRERYGTPLRAYNGRDALVDAYQEALDLLAYLQQAALEGQARGELQDLLDSAGSMVFALRAKLSERGGPC